MINMIKTYILQRLRLLRVSTHSMLRLFTCLVLLLCFKIMGGGAVLTETVEETMGLQDLLAKREATGEEKGINNQYEHGEIKVRCPMVVVVVCLGVLLASLQLG